MHSIKILATIPRRKDISEQQFHDHWRHPHGTLSKKIACLRGYVQSHRIVSPLLPDTQLAYDGITELWYDSLDDALNMGKNTAHRKYKIQIGRASCRERVGQYGEISVGGVN